jgi:DNA-binding transcriptional LysR family regulator
MADLAELPHAAATFGRNNLTPADRALGELGLRRRVQVEVSGRLPLPFVVEGTDMVAVVPERLARLHVGQLAVVPLPFGEVVLAEGYWFAATRLTDAAHRWLFERLDEVGALLSA